MVPGASGETAKERLVVKGVLGVTERRDEGEVPPHAPLPGMLA